MHEIHEPPRPEPIKIDSADIEIKEGYIITVHPGDTLVLCYPGWLTNGIKGRISRQINEVIPDICKCIVLEGGMTVDGVIRREDGIHK